MKIEGIQINVKTGEVKKVSEEIPDEVYQKQLKESEEKYRSLVNSMKDVIVRISPSGQLLYVSPSIKKFGGYDPDSEIGNNMSKYFENETDMLHAAERLAEVMDCTYL